MFIFLQRGARSLTYYTIEMYVIFMPAPMNVTINSTLEFYFNLVSCLTLMWLMSVLVYFILVCVSTKRFKFIFF